MEARLYLNRRAQGRAICDILNSLSTFTARFDGDEADQARSLWDSIKNAAEADGWVISADGGNAYKAFEADGAKGRAILAFRAEMAKGA